jgi:hypothetical protein
VFKLIFFLAVLDLSVIDQGPSIRAVNELDLLDKSVRWRNICHEKKRAFPWPPVFKQLSP